MKKFYSLLVALLLSIVSFAQATLPLDFEMPASSYTFTDFDGGVSTVIPNPHSTGINTSSQVVQMVKNAGQVWGGSFIALSSPIDFSVNKTFKMKVYSPRVGTKVLLKVENNDNAAISFEKQVLTTVANAWEDLTFDYATINTSNQYQKIVIIFELGTMGDGTANFTFLYDDIILTSGGGGGSLTSPTLPLDFESATVDYSFTDFDGGATSLISNPHSAGINTSSKVIQMVKNPGQVWGGSFISLASPINFSVNKTFKMKVYSPRVGAKVLLKVENQTDGSISFEKQVLTSVANAWEELTFDYTSISTTNQYQKIVVIFELGTMGDGSANFTFLFDDITLTSGGGSTTTLPTLPITFESGSVNYSFTDFDGGSTTTVSNPHITGINTSSKVGMMIKNGGQTWGGSFIMLASPIDFSVNKTFKMKVYSPRAGAKVLLKVENETDGSIFFEKEVLTTVANVWEDLSFDYSAISTSNQYKKIVIIFENGTMGDGSSNFTFFFDDITLTTGGGGGSLTQMNLPVTFDLATVDYGLIGFGGAEQSTIVADPTNASNKVAKVIKTATAELWAGTTVTASSGLGFASRIPFTASNTKMSVRVWSPNAGIPVRLKVEEHGDPTHSVETEATVTTASGWQTLEFNFANQASGTSPLNLAYNYDKASIFFNFGTTGAIAGEKTYYFDDMQFGSGGGSGSTNPVLPLDFESSTITYAFNDFDGGGTTVIPNPQSNGINTSSKVAKMVKNAGQTWGGSWIMLDAPIDFSVNRTFKMKVFSPRIGTKVLLKVENETDGSISYEKEVLTTVANAWEDLTFNYSTISTTNQYKKVVFIFDNGTMGDGSSNFTYLFDDLRLQGAPPALLQMNLPVTFDQTNVDYGLIGFGGAEQSSIETDFSNSNNKVAKVVKSATAELWAGTTITAASGLGFSSRIPFNNSNTKLSVRVFSTQAGIPVRLKLEEHGDATHSVETESLTTEAYAWQTLEFDFAHAAVGTAALNLTYNYDKASIFFNFGTPGSVAGEQTYYFDDVQFMPGGGLPTLPVMPVDFESNNVLYNFTDFDGGQATVINNPQVNGINLSSKVARMVKNAGQTWGGTSMMLASNIDFSVNKEIRMKVFSPRVGAKVLLKVENETDPSISYEKEVLTTEANNWEDLSFDFSGVSTTDQYKKLVIIFDNGIMGDGSSNFTFLFDEIKHYVGGGSYSLLQMDLPLTFDEGNVEYGLISYAGAEASIIADPTSSNNNVAKVFKPRTAYSWAATTITAPAKLGFANKVPFTESETKISVRVWSPDAGIVIRLHLVDHNDTSHHVQTTSKTTKAGEWETIVFDFANNTPGTSRLNLNYNYDKMAIAFNYGVSGANAGNKTYYFDDVMFVPKVVPVDSSNVFENTVAYPNPFMNSLFISNPTALPMNVMVYDLSGRQVKKITSTNNNIEVNMQNLAAGVYFAVIENKLSGQRITRKVVKL